MRLPEGSVALITGGVGLNNNDIYMNVFLPSTLLTTPVPPNLRYNQEGPQDLHCAMSKLRLGDVALLLRFPCSIAPPSVYTLKPLKSSKAHVPGSNPKADFPFWTFFSP